MFKIEIVGADMNEFKDKVMQFTEALFGEDKANIGEDPAPEGDGVREMYRPAPGYENHHSPPSMVTSLPEPTPLFTPAPAVEHTPIPNTPQSVGEVDADGVPWNADLHASSKAKTKDGKWRARRGLNKDETPAPTQVTQTVGGETQVHAAPSFQVVPPTPAMGAPVAAPTPMVAPSVQVATAPPVFTGAAPAVQATQTVVTPANAAPTYENIAIPQTQKPAHDLKSFRDNFIPTMVALMSAGQLTQEYVEILKVHFNVKEIWDVKKNDQQLSDLFENFVQYGFITKVG